MKRCFILFLSFFPLFSVCLFAEWSKPVPLSELNNYEQGYVADRHSVTGDGKIICFIHGSSLQPYSLFEAHLNEEGFYGEKRQVFELDASRNGIFSVWISEDGLRLYYAKAHKDSYGQFVRSIFFASRSNIDENWTQHTNTLRELDFAPYNTSATLTGDELEIVWAVQYYAGGPWKYCRAVRGSVEEPFGGIQELPEFAAMGAGDLRLAPDGMSIYFVLPNAEGLAQTWVGTRSSREESFGDFRPFDELNRWGNVTRFPSFSSDQKTVYFYQRQGAPGDITQMGLFVSEWFPNPYDVAVEKLAEAMELKRQAHDLITAAGTLEREARAALNQAARDDIADPISARELHKCQIEILHSLIKEIQASLFLRQSLTILEQVLYRLAPTVEEEALEPAVRPERPIVEMTKMRSQPRETR